MGNKNKLHRRPQRSQRQFIRWKGPNAWSHPREERGRIIFTEDRKDHEDNPLDLNSQSLEHLFLGEAVEVQPDQRSGLREKPQTNQATAIAHERD
jgi:hypothetical protein